MIESTRDMLNWRAPFRLTPFVYFALSCKWKCCVKIVRRRHSQQLHRNTFIHSRTHTHALAMRVYGVSVRCLLPLIHANDRPNALAFIQYVCAEYNDMKQFIEINDFGYTWCFLKFVGRSIAVAVAVAVALGVRIHTHTPILPCSFIDTSLRIDRNMKEGKKKDRAREYREMNMHAQRSSTIFDINTTNLKLEKKWFPLMQYEWSSNKRTLTFSTAAILPNHSHLLAECTLPFFHTVPHTPHALFFEKKKISNRAPLATLSSNRSRDVHR